MAASNGEILSTINLKCPIGMTSVYAGGDLVAVNNIGCGFNLYNFRTGMLVQSAITGCTSALITDVRFHENTAVVIGGSGRGKVYVVNLQQNAVIQELCHGGDTEPVQAIDAICIGDCYRIASGSSASEPDICIWEKEIKMAVIRPKQADAKSKYLLIALCLLTGTLLLITICQNLPVGIKILKDVRSLACLSN
ncbi:hypothetical protein ARMSODRAFT_1026234 [Armillaria solidipes]|uniref:WD40 repeat-like protein n=1 Tax=Armillaria solidipes TaxID=1076256 RepID=A0A2H3B863_9AGAR|nr:hypothetical protein ARMSODRAFT_1026234 [Armillaria solidipes]